MIEINNCTKTVKIVPGLLCPAIVVDTRFTYRYDDYFHVQNTENPLDIRFSHRWLSYDNSYYYCYRDHCSR